MVKRFLASLLTIVMVFSLVSGMTVFAAEEAVTVTADESWTEATYDPETKVLTNVTDGYSFTVAGNASSAALEMAADPITSPTVVIPSSFVYDGTIWNINRVGTNSDSSSNAHYRKGVHLGSGSNAKFSSGVTSATPANTDIKRVVVSKGIETIGYYALKNLSALEEIVLPDGLTTLKKGALNGATSLKTLVIPATVTSVENGAIGRCSGLESVEFLGETCPTINSNNNAIGSSATIIYYPANGTGYVDNARFSGRELSAVAGEPAVSDLTLIGGNVIGNTLTTSYTYTDPSGNPESGSIAVWESCEDDDFTSSDVYFLAQQECSASNPPSYVIQETDDGKYIRVTITPKHAGETLNVGAPVSAQLTEKVRLPQTMPIVKLTAPSNGYMVNCNSALTMSADVTLDSTTVTKVEFYVNNTKVAEDTTAPYEASWTPTEMGEYQIYAKAYNAIDEDGSSEAVKVTVLSEDAEIDAYITTVFTTPVADSRVFTGTAVEFTGTVVESSGAEITSFEIFANGKSLGKATLTATEATEEVPVPPYNFALSATLDKGSYEITSVANSADGKVGYGAAFKLDVSAMDFPNTISDNMVLQRNKPIKLSGYGIDGTTVTAELLGKTATATVSGGKWYLTLPSMPTTKSTTLKFTSSDGTEKIFTNVAIGEVILCSGQSNMTLSMGKLYTFASNNPFDGIRLFRTGSGSASSPQFDTLSGTWNVSTTELIKPFSATGYLTGYYYYLSQNGEVPVGLIQSAIGGSGISQWVPADAFDYDPDLKKLDKSSTHYNQMIAPWTNYTIGHILWYQGESDSQHSRSYEKALTRYIQTYKEKFDDDLNFIIISLPVFDAVNSYDSAFRHFWIVREGQINVSKYFDNVETVITTDSGSIYGIHPNGKDVIGQRAALVLEHFTSPSAELVWKSPDYAFHEIVGDKAIIHFNDVGTGLTTKDGLAPTAFKIAGDDMNFVDANATLVGNTVEIDISGITGTPYIRYACEDVPGRDGSTWNVNLVNSAGLPMTPFRTDDAKIQFNAYDEATGYSNPFNFVPMIREITASDIENGTAVITIDAHEFDDAVASVELFVDGTSVGQAVQSTENIDTWTFDWTAATTGEHIFHAVATDVLGDVSTRTSATFSEIKTVTPQKFTYNLVNKKTDITVAYDATNGAVANTTLDGVLVIAAYKGDELVKAVIAKNGAKTASIPAADLATAVEIKAFVFESLSNIKPLTTPATTTK